MKKSSFIVGLIILAIVLVVAIVLARNVFAPQDVKEVVEIDGGDREVVEVDVAETEKDVAADIAEGEVAEDKLLPTDEGFKDDGQFAADEDMGVDLKELEKKNKARLSLGCFSGKDCIPSIDNPKFITASQASYLLEDEFVIGLFRNEEARAYPLSVLNWHEIVNDKVGDEYIAVSFCPLCYTGNAFIREVDGSPSEFGVSGYLINSNLVMYDRNTDSLWEQLTGKAIVGPQIGKKLKKITVSTVPWADWKEQHPDTVVLSTDTGFSRNYTEFPYGDYNTSRDIFFSVENRDDRLFEKELTYGIVVNDNAKAYSKAALDEQYPEGGEFDDTVGGHPVKVSWMNGTFTAEDYETGEEIVAEINFWFAWAAFYPGTEVWG